ncbi:MAG: polysaccharide biosynthesis protein [Phycisphaerales bacterium]|nr:polysaccharide biosynthesis protein [Phycisphaerales bacterium]
MSVEAPSSPARFWREWTYRHHQVLNVAAHVLLFAVAWVLAFGLAYNFKGSPTLGLPFNWLKSLFVRVPPPAPDAFDWFTQFCLPLIVPVVAVKVIVFVLMGLDRGTWRYVSLRDVFSVTRAAWLGFLVIFVLYYALQNARWLGLQPVFSDKFPDSVFVLDFAGTIALVVGARLAVRLYHEEVRPTAEGVTPKLLIIGAGNAGENVVREILRMPVMRYRVVGFLDDDPAKQGSQIHGIEVLGNVSQVKEICAEYSVDEILIAIPSATRDRLRRVVELCQGTNLRFKTVPALSDLISGKATVKEIRDVDINDLLGRPAIKLDEDEIAKFIRGRVVAVTGAGGSIGSEMCRQMARFEPKRLVLIERAEPTLFTIDRELRAAFPRLTVVPYVADIGDEGRLEHIFAEERPSAVVHAAAHKHVPMMELNPGEAIKNNVRGTRVLADCAARHRVEKFVMISTDKAVNPTSIMGCSKRVAEMYVQALAARTQTQFVTVRFGNVLGSSGSVIPIFRDQIARGGPVTVTHPDMVRYFMTIPEASQLVLQAASMGRGGEIFVLDMGEPVKIVDMARQMITLSGFRPDADIKIEFVGLRPGEKLYEELAIDGENVARTAHPKVGIWKNIPSDWDTLVAQIDRLIADADGFDRTQARRRLKEIVPEFYLEPPPVEPLPAGVGSTAGTAIEARVATA